MASLSVTSSPTVVVITGTSSGIGLAITQQLAESPEYKIYATCRNPSTAHQLQKIQTLYNNIIILPLNVRSSSSVSAGIKHVWVKEGKIDVVINNAGGAYYGPSEMLTIKESLIIFDTIVFGTIRVTQAVLPIMRQQSTGGRILNIGSISGAFPSGNIPDYSAAKAAIASLTASFAAHCGPHVKFSLIQPGPVLTDFESSTVFGSRFPDNHNPYDALAEARGTWSETMKSGQSPAEVAKVIQQVIKSPQPHLWYQTSKRVTETILQQYKDPTGDSFIPKTKIKFKSNL